MSDRDIPSVPVTTLAGLNSLSDLLSELPVTESLPSASSQKKSLLFHTLVADESKNLLSVRDDNLVKQLVNAIEQTNSDHIELKEQFTFNQHGTNISGLPELLQGIYQHRPTVFNAPNSQRQQLNFNQTQSNPTISHIPYSDVSLNRRDSTISSDNQMDHQQLQTHQINNLNIGQQQTVAATTTFPQQQSSVILQTPQLSQQHSSVITLNNSRNNTSLQQQQQQQQQQPQEQSVGNFMHNHNNLPQQEFQSQNLQLQQKTTPRNNEYLQQQSIQSDLRGSSPAQASIAPESNTPPTFSEMPATNNVVPNKSEDTKVTPRIGITSSKLLPKVCIARLKPEEEKLMQESIKKFAEKQPELAKKIGIKSDPDVKSSSDIFSEMKDEEKRVPSKRKHPVLVEEECPPEKIFSQPKVRRVERLVAAPTQKCSKEEIIKSQSYQQFMKNMDIIIEQLDDTEQPNFNSDDVDENVECIPSKMLSVMSNDVAKLKARGALDTIPKNKLTLLINYAMRNIYLAKNYAAGPDEDDEFIGDDVIDKILNAMEACLLICNIYSTVKDIKFLQEDNITMILKFLQFQLKETIYPSYDPVYTCLKSTKKEKKKSKSQQNYHSRGIQNLYSKSVELIKVLVTLFDKCIFVDTIVLSLSTMAIEPFFVDNIDTLQFVCLELVTTIFRKEMYEKIRSSILTDIFTSIDRLPCSKKNLRPFKLDNNGGSIQMVTALVLQLVQCSTILPESLSDTKKSKGGGNENNEDTANDSENKNISDKDIKILKKFDVAIGIGANFLTTFLSKCKTKSNETDFRPLFENFIYDLLSTVNKPEWPASELLLSLLGTLLVRCMSDKTKEISTRLASLDYLGIVAARLRKDTVESKCKVNVIDAMIASIKLEQEKEGDCKKKNNNIVLDPEEERTEFLQKILLDYLAVNAQEENLVWDYARHFYLVQWYRDIINQRKRIAEGEKGYASKKKKTHKKKRRNDSRTDEELTSSSEEEDEDEEAVKKSSKVIDVELNLEIFKILDNRKRYLLSKVKAFSDNNCTSQHIKTYIDYNNAHLIAQYLASKRTFSQSFDKFLQKIILVVNESSIAIRTRAIKCLANIVEVDPLVLKRKDMQIGVNQKFLDQAISVREAAVDLIGKYVLNSEELIDQYYDIISQRILDTGVSVRKRVIKILRDICIEYPDFEKIPEICVKMIRRVNDEEGIQKLVTEVFMKMWFTACKDNNKVTIQRKISQIIDVVNISHETGTSWIEGLLTSIFAPKEMSKGDSAMGEPIKKNTEAPPEIVLACQQLADGLVDRLILLEDIDNSKMYGCITTLHLFAKARPELLIRHAITIEPYLNMRGQTALAQKFICCVADILEKVVPLVTNPSESFLASLEEHLMFLVISFNQAVVSSCISCLSALVNKITKNYKLIRDCFVRFYKQMVKSKEHVLANPTVTIDKIYTPIFRRSLFTIGILMRYFDFKSRRVLGIDEGDNTISPNVCDDVFQLLMYFSTYDSLEIRKQALVSLGQFCVQNDEYLTRTELKEFYCDLLKLETVEPYMKTSVMRNIWLYLTESENIMHNKEKDWEKQAKTENLKEMNDVTSGMASRIIQLYLEEILACFLHKDYSVRLWAVKVVAIVLRQGLVAPQRMVPWLIALSTDEKQETAHRADALLKEIDKTYVGYINQKIQLGLQTSFKLQKVIKGENAVVRGYIKRDPNNTLPTSLNDFVYTLLRTTKPQRRAFIHTVTKQFDDLKITLKQMLYLADNLAYFPYVVQDEPLYLIHQIDLMISVTGTNLLSTFKEGLKPPEGERDILEDDDDEDDPDVLVQRLPDETKELEKCITSAQGCMLLLVLKQHLKDMYGLTDGKISRYSPSETQKIYEKNITRKQVPEFNPKTTIDIIKNDTSTLSQLDSVGRRDLVVKYLDFKQLMLKLDPDEEDSATEDLNKSKLNNTSTFNSDGTDQINESSPNLNNSSLLENSTQDVNVNQTINNVNKVTYNKSNKEVQGTPLTKSSSKSTPGKLPPRKQPTRSKRKKRKIISSDTDEDDDEEEDDDYDFS